MRVSGLKNAKVGDYIRLKSIETGVRRTVKVTEREAQRGRYGWTRVTVRFVSGTTYNLWSKDFGKFVADKATKKYKKAYDRGDDMRESPAKPPEPPNTGNEARYRYYKERAYSDFYESFFGGARPPRPTPPAPKVDDSFSVFMKYAGIDKMPRTVAELNDAKKKAVFALHPDRSGFESTELFLKAMEAYNCQLRAIQ